MGEVLSQSEIDALLAAFSTGELEVELTSEAKEKSVRNYNFARPSKFNKDHLRTLENIFDNYCRIVTTYLTGYLRSNIAVEVVNSEQVTYSEFSNSLSNPVIFAVSEFAPLKGSIVLELSAAIGYVIVDRVLGGAGEVIRKMRDFTEIEKVLIERVINQLLGLLAEPWENVHSIKPKLNSLETNSQFSTIMSPNEMVALVTLNVKVGDVEGFMHFCIPHLVLEPIIGRLNTKYWYQSTNDAEDKEVYKMKVEKQISTAKVPIKALLGRTTITVDEFVALQKGDIITLDSFVDSDLEIMVGSLLKFRGKPGTSKKFNALQITTVLRKEE